MALARYVKAAGETKRYSIDYADWLDTGEVLTNVAFSVLNNTVVTPLVVGSLAFEPGNLAIQFLVSGGVDGIAYEVIATATTTGAQIKKDALVYTVREPQ